MRNLLLILLAAVAAFLASEFMVRFHEWNRQQACMTAGGRNCGPPRTFLQH